MPRKTWRGLPSASRISTARAATDSERASSSKPAASMEIGKALARTVRPADRSKESRGVVADPLAAQPHEVLQAAGKLEADQVGAQQALQDLAAPGQLLEQLGR